MYVERVLAKVRLYTDWKDMTLKNDVTYGDNDKKYTAVKLKRVRTVPNLFKLTVKMYM